MSDLNELTKRLAALEQKVEQNIRRNALVEIDKKDAP